MFPRSATKKMEEKRDFKQTIKNMVKLHPIIFMVSLFSILYGITMGVVSSIELSFYIGITGSYSLILGISKMYGLKKYEGIESGMTQDVLEVERKTTRTIAISTSVMSFLHFSFAIVSTFFYEENPNNYGIVLLWVVSGSAFVKIILSTIQSIRTRKNHNIIIHQIRLASICNALISLSLTQRSILYFVGDELARFGSGIGGIFFSLCAGIVCVLMFTKYKKRELGEVK